MALRLALLRAACLWDTMSLDKKARGNNINFILPTRIGHVERVENVPPEAVRAALSGAWV